jgi:aminoglycoside phosphotransferase (APT) family kinase protein
MPHQAKRHEELEEVAERLGGRLLVAEPVGWGDARATHRLSLADGRTFAARRFAGQESGTRVERIGRVMVRLAEAGLPVPKPTTIETAGAQWLLTDWADGEPGPTWLGDPDRARHVADRMGRMARRLRAVDLGDLGGLGLRGGSSTDPAPRDDVEPTTFVHGDFAPVNVVVGPDGEIAALLDFEHAGVGPALLDVGWWGWVVRHHHPAAWTAAWPTFLSAAGLEPGHIEARLHGLVLRTLADRAASAGDATARERWQERLTAARSWRVPGDQAT